MRLLILWSLCVVVMGIQSARGADETQAREQRLAAEPFGLSQVRLLDGPLKEKLEANRRYLLSLDPGRLLHTFRINAKLPTTAEPLGGWEAPSCELRGHFVGHYLSGCALMYQSTGDEEIRSRADKMVAALGECQKALGGEYLSAFPESYFDRLEAGTPVWAPYYTIHKIMAGLLDVNQAWGNAQALDEVKGMGRYFAKRNAKLNDAQMRVVWKNEFGGMMEVAYNLYAATGDEQFKELAEKFDQSPFFDPLAKHVDNLTRLHANTHIPKIIGAARRYELSGDDRFRAVAEFFWDQVTNHRAFVTGGTSTDEHWRTTPDRLASELSFTTQETCCTYNMLKLTRHLFSWDPQAKYADYYERAFLNSIWPSQDTGSGQLTYFLSLKPGGYKLFSTPTNSFWCCDGTGVETWSKLSDSVYFHDEDSLYVNLFVPTELKWKERGLVMRQETKFPEEAGTTLTMKLEKPAEFALKLRIPWWAEGSRILVNGQAIDIPSAAASYAAVTRKWNDGDRIELKTPMRLHLQAMPDDPTVAAVMYGPVVLAGRLGSENLTHEQQFKQDQLMYTQGTIDVPPLLREGDDLTTSLQPVPDHPLEFIAPSAGGPVTLAPIYSIQDERYTVYWKIATKPADAVKQWRDEQATKAAYRLRMIDEVKPGDRDSERAHARAGEHTNTGSFEGRNWRDARGADGQAAWFSWNLAVKPGEPMVLACTYWGDEVPPRSFDILVDGQTIATQSLEHNKPGEFFSIEYPLSPEMVAGKEKITVRFQAKGDAFAGGVFGCAILKGK